jgi:hypothetical protein
MPDPGRQGSQFYREVARGRVVWTVREGEGGEPPAPQAGSGRRVRPVWSSRGRLEAFIDTFPPPRSRFRVEAISWDAFCDRWLPDLRREGLLMGINWPGLGSDENIALEPVDVRQRIDALIDEAAEGWDGLWMIYAAAGTMLSGWLLAPRLLLIQLYGWDRFWREHLTVVERPAKHVWRISNGDTIDARAGDVYFIGGMLCCFALAFLGYTLSRRRRLRRKERRRC